MNSGYWPSNYWPNEYWDDNYWQDFTATPTPAVTPTSSPPRYRRNYQLEQLFRDEEDILIIEL